MSEKEPDSGATDRALAESGLRIEQVTAAGRQAWQAHDEAGVVAMADTRAGLLDAIGHGSGEPREATGSATAAGAAGSAEPAAEAAPAAAAEPTAGPGGDSGGAADEATGEGTDHPTG